MSEDMINVGGVSVPFEEYMDLCRQANDERVKVFGVEVSPLRDYAFQVGYIMGSVGRKGINKITTQSIQ